MIWNQDLLYQIIDVWYHIRKLYLINNEKNDKIKLNHFFYKRRPISNTFVLKDKSEYSWIQGVEPMTFWPQLFKRWITLSTA